MHPTPRTLCTLAAFASVSLGGLAFAQDGAGPGTMDPTEMPPAGKMDDKMAGAMSMAANMKADQTILSQLMKIAQSPDMAGEKLFVLHTAMGNMWEVEISKLVMEKSQDPMVKDLAKQIMQDHSMNQEKLMPLAQKMSLELPAALPSIKAVTLEIMKKLPIDKLEVAYLCDMKAGHAATLTSFVDHASVVKDEALKSYIDESIPKLKEHTMHVLKVAKSKNLPGDMTVDSGTSDKEMKDANDMK